MITSLRQMTSLALLGSLWCIIEIYGDLLLRSLQIPLRGALLMSFGIVFLSVAQFTLSGRWLVLGLGLLTATLKLLILGVWSLWPSLGILIETVLVQTIFLIGRPGQRHVVLAGMVGVTWSFFHPFVTHGLIAGAGIYRVYLNLIEKSMQVFRLQLFSPLQFFFLWLLLHTIFGLVAGIIAWNLVQLIQRRLLTLANRLDGGSRSSVAE